MLNLHIVRERLGTHELESRSRHHKMRIFVYFLCKKRYLAFKFFRRPHGRTGDITLSWKFWNAKLPVHYSESTQNSPILWCLHPTLQLMGF